MSRTMALHERLYVSHNLFYRCMQNNIVFCVLYLKSHVLTTRHIKINEIISRYFREALTYCSRRGGRHFSCTQTYSSTLWRTNVKEVSTSSDLMFQNHRWDNYDNFSEMTSCTNNSIRRKKYTSYSNTLAQIIHYWLYSTIYFGSNKYERKTPITKKRWYHVELTPSLKDSKWLG